MLCVNALNVYSICGVTYQYSCDVSMDIIITIFQRQVFTIFQIPCCCKCNSWKSSGKFPKKEYYTSGIIPVSVFASIPTNIENLPLRSDPLREITLALRKEWKLYKIVFETCLSISISPVWYLVISNWSKTLLAFHHQWCFVWVKAASR